MFIKIDFCKKKKKNIFKYIMSTQESVLNNMLELCEKEMSEGDYLIAASLLKIASEKKDVRSVFRNLTFDSPINIKIGKLNLIIHSIVQKLVNSSYGSSYYVTESVNVQFTDENFSIKKSLFEIWMSFLIKKEMAIEVHLCDNFSPNSNINYDKFKKFILKREELDDEGEDWIYSNYSSYISEVVKQSIELKTRIIT
jgi:hypothetical protein